MGNAVLVSSLKIMLPNKVFLVRPGVAQRPLSHTRRSPLPNRGVPGGGRAAPPMDSRALDFYANHANRGHKEGQAVALPVPNSALPQSLCHLSLSLSPPPPPPPPLPVCRRLWETWEPVLVHVAPRHVLSDVPRSSG
jgi:hypothetical protein